MDAHGAYRGRMSAIKGPAALTLPDLLLRLPITTHKRFAEMCTASWAAAAKYELDPIGLAAQMAVETGWGNFPGKARPEFHNPCGLKWHDALRTLYPDLMTGDMPLAHAAFASWRTGCEAHAQHVLAYTLAVLPAWQVVVDTRYADAVAQVREKFGRGAVEWRDLGGMWAPSADYGTKLETVRANLIEGRYGLRQSAGRS